MKTFIEYNYCAESWENHHNKCTLTLTNGEKVGLSNRCKTYSKEKGCTDSAKLNLTVSDYSYLMGLTGLTISLIFAFVVNLIITFVSRK
jgi:hypothetical protein